MKLTRTQKILTGVIGTLVIFGTIGAIADSSESEPSAASEATPQATPAPTKAPATPAPTPAPEPSNQDEEFCLTVSYAVLQTMNAADPGMSIFETAGYHAGIAAGIGKAAKDYRLSRSVSRPAGRLLSLGNGVLDAAERGSMSDVLDNYERLPAALGDLTDACGF